MTGSDIADWCERNKWYIIGGAAVLAGGVLGVSLYYGGGGAAAIAMAHIKAWLAGETTVTIVSSQGGTIILAGAAAMEFATTYAKRFGG